MTSSETTPTALVREKAPLIWEELHKATSVLLHCHPSPDPDSVCSALAMKLVLEGMGKKATIIKGDSEIPRAFMHFPGASSIEMTDYFETDLSRFDLFVIVDASITGVSRKKPISIPASLRVVNIDHHRTNTGDGAVVSLVDSSYPANCQILYDLFRLWGVEITHDIAANLFMGMYTDTGGFRFGGTTPATYEAATELVRLVPDFSRIVEKMNNSDSAKSLAFRGLCYRSVQTFYDGFLALALVPHDALVREGIPKEEAHAGLVSPALNAVADWTIVGAVLEPEPGRVKVSFRSKDGATYDVSALAAALGGGGHRAAAGVAMDMPFEQAKELIVTKAKELYNL